MLTVEQAELDFKELQTKIIGLKKQKDYDKKEMMRMQCRMSYLKKKFGFEEEKKKQEEKQLYKQVSSNIHLSIKTRLQQLEEKANKLLQEAKTEEERKSIKERLYYARLRATYSQQ
jgi:hypothetical protein